MSMAGKYIKGNSEIPGTVLLIDRNSIEFKKAHGGLISYSEDYIIAFDFNIVSDSYGNFEGSAHYWELHGSASSPSESGFWIDVVSSTIKSSGTLQKNFLISALKALPSLQGPGYYINGTQKRIHKGVIFRSNIPS